MPNFILPELQMESETRNEINTDWDRKGLG